MICSPYPSFAEIEGRYVVMPITMMLAVIALTGNVLILTVILKYEALRSQSAYRFIASLASADILVSLLAQPLYVTVLKLGSNNSCLLKCVSHFVGTLSSSASSLGILIVSIDRYYFITRPMHYHAIMTPFRVNIALGYIWITSLFLSSMPYIVGMKSFHIIVFTATLASLVITTYCYYTIYRIVTHKVGDEIITAQNKSRRQHQATRTVALVLLAMTVCWTPYIACSLVWALDIQGWTENAGIKSVYFWLLAIGHSNSALNVLIYSWKNTELRAAMKRFLGIGDAKREPMSSNMNEENMSNLKAQHASNLSIVESVV